MDNGASFDTPEIPGGVQVVELSQFLRVNVKYFNGGAIYIFFITFELKPDVTFSDFTTKKRIMDIYNILVPELQKL